MLSERENNNESYSLGICGLFGKDKMTNPSRTERACLFWLPDESTEILYEIFGFRVVQ